MDRREYTPCIGEYWSNIDHKKMTADFTDWDGTINVKFKYEICDLCEGKGVYTNPSIDSHGLSREDFAEDPDFTEHYFSGAYDIVCRKCDGLRVVPAVDEDNNSKQNISLIKNFLEEQNKYAREAAYERKMGY